MDPSNTLPWVSQCLNDFTRLTKVEKYRPLDIDNVLGHEETVMTSETASRLPPSSSMHSQTALEKRRATSPTTPWTPR